MGGRIVTMVLICALAFLLCYDYEIDAETHIQIGEPAPYSEKEIAGQVISLSKIDTFEKQGIITPVTDPKKGLLTRRF